MTALVTGAAGAIGSAVVGQLISKGIHVIAQDLLVDGLARYDARHVTTVAGDLLDRTCSDLLASAVHDNPIDRVIAAHGIDGSGELGKLSDDYVERVMRINTESIPALLDVTRKSLSQSDGVFMVVDSQAGLVAERDNIAYCASKFAIVGWAGIMRPALAQEGINLRLFCPGCTETPLLYAAQARFAAAQDVDVELFVERRRERIPIQRFATVEQTAAGACFMAEPGQSRPAVFAATGGEVLY